MNTTRRPLIGITTGSRPDRNQPWKSDEVGQKQDYIEAIERAGGIPVLLPYTDDADVLRGYVDGLDGFLLAGGGDVDPVLYGEENTYSSGVNLERDRFEVELVKYIDTVDKPLLGICRGLQIVNVAREGKLFRDIPTQLHGNSDYKLSDELEDSAGIAHSLEVVPESLLSQIVAVEVVEVNSRHHRAVSHVGEGLTVSGRSGDGIIEALEDPARSFLVAVQFHPEAMFEEADSIWFKLFTSFVEASRGAGESSLIVSRVTDKLTRKLI